MAGGIRIAAFSLLWAPVFVSAHHSRAEFTNETVEIEGVLTEVVWRNPHIALFLDVTAETGEVETWRVEGWTNPHGLEQNGVESSLFEIGKPLTVAGRPSRFRQTVLGTNALLANGSEAILAPNVSPRWDAAAIVGAEPESAPSMVDADAENQGIFRAWYPAVSPMMLLRRFPFSQASIAARADWDPIDNPLTRCEEPGMPMPLFHARPILFSALGKNIGMHISYFDIRRTIHMDASLNAHAQPQTHLGFSQGSWIDERTLEIETTRINYPYIDMDGSAQSQNVRVVERYSLSDDQTRLDFHLTIEDSWALTETVELEWHYLAREEPFSVYECNVF